MKLVSVMTISCAFLLFACTGSSGKSSNSYPKTEIVPRVVMPEVQKLKWETYINFRFEFCLEYPAGFLTPGDPPTNGDGMSFFTRNQEGKILAWGTHILIGGTLAEDYKIDKQDGLDSAGRQRRVTYTRLAGNWYVNSGFLDEKNIFYRKVKERDDQTFVVIQFEYPKADKKTWDPIVTRVADSWPDCE